ncbi:helix-turn-helix domain-containing protein [Polyangium sorediatum]|uniref:helix-turn-helix domain-containing protein n=1 Tax=Polyangium sorediatum TaxID=889274 RepID=UPI003CCBC351
MHVPLPRPRRAPRPAGHRRGGRQCDAGHDERRVVRARLNTGANLAIERRRIDEALGPYGGNQTRAAEMLGMPRPRWKG